MKVTLEERKKDFRTIYELWYGIPRIEIQEIMKALGVSRQCVQNRIHEALEQGYITGPHIRKMSFKTFDEWVYFGDVQDPLETYESYAEDESTIYHSILDGFCNFRAFTEGRLTIGNTLVTGLSTDCYMTYALDRSWRESLCSMDDKLRKFDPDLYTSKHILKNHWNETIEWTETDKIVFRELKYDFRKSLTKIREKHDLWKGHVMDSYRKIYECCNIYTAYFPETIFAYDPVIFMFETDYEDFVIDLFSELPTTIFCYKVLDKLFIHTWLDTGLMQSNSSVRKVSKTLPFLKFLRDLQKKEIVKSEAHAKERSYWRRDEDV